EYGEEGPWAVFPVRDRTQAILAAAVGQLRRLAPPPSQRADYAAFTDAAARLLAVGRGWNAAQAAGDVGAAAHYLDWAPAYPRSCEAFGTALGMWQLERRSAR